MPEALIPEPTALERGDILPEAPAPEPDHPDAEGVATELTAELEKEKEAKKDNRIPLARHKEILAKERDQRATLERELAQYKQGGQIADMNAELTAAENEIAKMDAEYDKLITDGELSKAAELKQKIRKTERSMAESKSDIKIHAAEIRAAEATRYNIAVERIEASYPELNPDHDEYDEALSLEIIDLKDAYQMKGLTPTQAMQKAVKILIEPRTARQKKAVETQPQVSEKSPADERKIAAVAKTAAATKGTPPNLNSLGVDGDSLGQLDAKSVMAMSQAEFAKLSPAVIARLRGDTL